MEYVSPKSGDASLIDSKNWGKSIESTVLWFEGPLGVDHIPLSHLICVHDMVIQDNMDRRKGEPNSNYITHQQEMVVNIL